MIFPIGDDQVIGGYKPIFSYAFIGLNIIFFLLQLTTPDLFICEYGAIPYEVVRGQDTFTLLTSMFMHGGWMHLIGNMLFLWVFADNIEATVGNLPFLAFYLMGGLAASAAHIYIGAEGGGDMMANCCMPCNEGNFSCQGQNVCAGSIPTVGASGAISAVLGAYLVMFPQSKVKMLVIYFFRSFKIPALWFLGFWIGQQLLSGFASLGPENAQTSGTAWWAHIGGFAFGVFAGFFARGSKGKGGTGSPSPTPPPEKKYGDRDFV